MNLKQVLAIGGVGLAGAAALSLTVLTDEGAPRSIEAAEEVVADAPSPAPIPQGAVQVQSRSAVGVLQQTEDAIDVGASFPQGPALAPVAGKLRDETQEYFDRVRRDAVRVVDGPQWELRVNWREVASVEGYVSVLGRASEYRGGAHPVELVEGRLFELPEGKEIRLQSMMAKGWPSPAFTIAVCEQLKVAKRERIGAETILDEPIVCAGPYNNLKLGDAKLVLAGSSEAGRFGGVHVLYPPYAIGSYAEGGYEVTVPHDVIAEDIAPAFRGLFAGSPLPLQD